MGECFCMSELDNKENRTETYIAFNYYKKKKTKPYS